MLAYITLNAYCINSALEYNILQMVMPNKEYKDSDRGQ